MYSTKKIVYLKAYQKNHNFINYFQLFITKKVLAIESSDSNVDILDKNEILTFLEYTKGLLISFRTI